MKITNQEQAINAFKGLDRPRQLELIRELKKMYDYIHEPYITTYKSIGGYKAVMMVWDEELGAYAPWQTSVMGGFMHLKNAVEDAKKWAEDEEIVYVEDGGRNPFTDAYSAKR